MTEVKNTGLAFGEIIAFVAPGFIALKAVAYHVPFVNIWLTPAAIKDQSLGVFLFVFLGSLALGIVVSGVRALLIDKFLSWRIFCRFAVTPTAIDWSKIDDKKLAILNDLVESYYRYYQFYANSLVALLSLIIAYKLSPKNLPLAFGYWAVLTLISFALLWSARDTFKNYSEAIRKLQSKSSYQPGEHYDQRGKKGD